MDHLFDEFSESLAESLPRRESLRRMGAMGTDVSTFPLTGDLIMDPSDPAVKIAFRSARRRPAFTGIEVIAVISVLAVLAVTLIPSFQAARINARRAQVINSLHQLAQAVALYHQDYGMLPDVLYPRLENYVDYELAELTRISEAGRAFQGTLPDDIPLSDAVPYFILSIQEGTSDFRIAAGLGLDPTRYRGRDYFDPNAFVLTPCLFDDCDPIVTPATISSFEVVSLDTEFPEVWSWDPTVKPPKRNSVIQDASHVLSTVRAAEMITEVLKNHPELFNQIRRTVDRPEVLAVASAMLDLNHDGAMSYDELISGPGGLFEDLLRPGPDDGEVIDAIVLADLHAKPSDFFSYDTMHVLTRFYVDQAGLYEGLAAKLDAAQASEIRGNLKAKSGQIKAFQNQVSAQSGKALLPDQARVLLTFSSTL